MKKVNPLNMIIVGLIFGFVIRMFDIYTEVLGNIFSSISVYILIGVLITLNSKNKWYAMINVFVFLLSMLLTYYLTAYITHGVYGKRFIIGWTISAFLSPIMAYFVYLTKSKNLFANIIKIGILIVAVIFPIILFDKLYFYDYLVILALIYLLYIKKIDKNTYLCCSFSNIFQLQLKYERKNFMNTDKIYAEQIANEYSKKSESKVIALKKLDRKAKLPAQIFTYSFGIVSALIFGTGMCLSMGVIGKSVALGIFIGIIGIFCVSINYPIYKRILKNSKDKYSYDIIKLASEIAKED